MRIGYVVTLKLKRPIVKCVDMVFSEKFPCFWC